MRTKLSSERPMLKDRTSPAGTWQIKITSAPDAAFEEGGLKGETVEGLAVLEPDHTFVCLIPGPGAGTWQSRRPSSIAFEFTELINYQADGGFSGYVTVTQRGTVSPNGDTFTSAGQGVICDADGAQVAIVPTTTEAARVDHPDRSTTLPQ